MKHAPAAPAAAPAGKAREQHLGIDVEKDNGIERLANLRQQLREAVGLHDRAGEAVEDESAPRIGLREPFADDAEHRPVVHELARVHHGLRRAPELRARGNGLAQQVARGHLRHVAPALEALRLRALPRAGCAEQD